MERKDIIPNVKRYFALRELVDEPTYKKYGDFLWVVWRPDVLETLFVLRDKIIKKPMIVNDWMTGGTHTQRGLRHNLSELIKAKTAKNSISLSAHGTAAGLDFVVPGMTANEVRAKIVENQNLLPYPIRLEDNASAPTWVHFDLYNDGSKSKIVFFKV